MVWVDIQVNVGMETSREGYAFGICCADEAGRTELLRQEGKGKLMLILKH